MGGAAIRSVSALRLVSPFGVLGVVCLFGACLIYYINVRARVNFFAWYFRLHSYRPDGAFLNAEVLDIC